MKINNTPELFYVEDGCYSWTFQAKKVKKIVESNCKGSVLNLFAGLYRLNISETRVDKPDAIIDFQPDYCMEAFEFLIYAISNGIKYDTIIYDPPWNDRKNKEYYNGKRIGVFTKLKPYIMKILTKEGQIISIGYEISNFGKIRHMKIQKIYVINSFGEIRPYFISIEQKVPSLKLIDYVMEN